MLGIFQDTARLVRNCRKAAGLTQSQLAAAAGVSYQTVQLLESGKGNPSHDLLCRLLAVLGIGVAMRPLEADWEPLVRAGLALAGSEESARGKAGKTPSAAQIKMSVAAAVTEVSAASALGITVASRKTTALAAFLYAISHHYGRFYARHFAGGPVDRWLKKQPITGEILKLRRMSLARLAEVL